MKHFQCFLRKHLGLYLMPTLIALWPTFLGGTVVVLGGASADFREAQPIRGSFEGSPRLDLLRKSFQLANVPASATLLYYGGPNSRVSLNGSVLGADPNQAVEFDVSSLLKTGENVLAIEQLVDSEDDFAIARLVDDKGNTLAATGPDWRSHLEAVNKRNVVQSAWNWSGLHVREGVPNENLNYLNIPVGFNEPAFVEEAGRWSNVNVGGAVPSVGHVQEEGVHTRQLQRPQALEYVGEILIFHGQHTAKSDPSNLARRLFYQPLMDRVFTRYTNVEGLLESEQGVVEIENVYPRTTPGFYQALEDGVVPAVACPTLIVDFGRELTGPLFLDIETDSAGTVAEVGFSRVLVGGRVVTMPYDSGMNPDRGNYAHSVVLREGRQVWQSFSEEPVRYVILSLREFNKPVRIHDFGILAK